MLKLNYDVMGMEDIKQAKLHFKKELAALSFDIINQSERTLILDTLEQLHLRALLLASEAVINKDNINLYYEFMSDEDIKKYTDVLKPIFQSRWQKLNDVFAGQLILRETTFNDYTMLPTHVFDIKDILKPIDEYIAEIKAGMRGNELAQLSKFEMNELLNEIYSDVVITKENIHLYYEFMGDADKLKYLSVFDTLYNDRFVSIYNALNISASELRKNSYALENNIFILYTDFFGVKDTLKPVDEYIAEIKASDAYIEYVIAKKS